MLSDFLGRARVDEKSGLWKGRKLRRYQMLAFESIFTNDAEDPRGSGKDSVDIS